MILAGTSVWIDHLSRLEQGLIWRLREGQVLMHAMIVGELACRNLNNRHDRLRERNVLPQVTERSHIYILAAIASLDWTGKGLGFVNVRLLASDLRHEGPMLWTRSKKLDRCASTLKFAYIKSNRE